MIMKMNQLYVGEQPQVSEESNQHLHPPDSLAPTSSSNCSHVSIKLQDMTCKAPKLMKPKKILTNVDPKEYVLIKRWRLLLEQLSRSIFYFCAGLLTDDKTCNIDRVLETIGLEGDGYTGCTGLLQIKDVDVCNLSDPEGTNMGKLLITLGIIIFIQKIWYILTRGFEGLQEHDVFVKIMNVLLNSIAAIMVIIYIIWMIYLATTISIPLVMLCRGMVFSIALILSWDTCKEVVIVEMISKLRNIWKKRQMDAKT